MITRDIVYGTLETAYIPQLKDINMHIEKFYSVVVVELKENPEAYIDLDCKIIYDIKECMTKEITMKRPKLFCAKSAITCADDLF